MLVGESFTGSVPLDWVSVNLTRLVGRVPDDPQDNTA